MLLVNGFIVPSLVKELEVVGFVEVLQQTPNDVSADPPVAVTVPPELAELDVIEVITSVETDGPTPDMVKLSSFP